MRRRATEKVLPLVVFGLGLSGARADNAVVPDLPPMAPAFSTALPLDESLQLEIRLRDRPTGLIAEVRREADGGLRAKGADLRRAGLLVPAAAGEWTRLDAVPGLNCRYILADQALDCDAPDALLAPKTYSLVAMEPPAQPPASDFGAVVNYDFYTGAANWSAGQSPRYSLATAALTLDARVFSPYGNLRQTGVVGDGLLTGGSTLRYDTTVEFIDDQRLMAARGGDLVSGGLDWTRPIRLGGMQIASDFSPRPDLILHPMPSVGGSAAVPTSVDVYMNDFKVFSQNVDPGPYRIANLPAMGEGGTATLVVRDASGAETRVAAPFFVSPKQLSEGVLSYSFEGGWARTQYGQASFSYDPRPVGLGAVRYGLSDGLTLEGHSEDGAGLVNGGAGAAVDVFGRGLFEAALAGSAWRGERGLQVFLGAQTSLAGFDLDVSSQRAFGRYLDLAAVTAPKGSTASILSADFGGWLANISFDPPRVLDRVSLGYGDPGRLGRLTATLTSIASTTAPEQRLLALGYSHSLFRAGSVSLTGFAGSVGGARTVGALAMLTWTLGADVSASLQAGRGASGPATQLEVARTGDESVGSLSWRATASNSPVGEGDADVSYVTPYARLAASAGRSGSGALAAAQGSADVQGSLVMLGGQLAAAPPIRDGFALVDAGVPGVAVTFDNRPIGVTDSFGSLLAPDLRAYDTHLLGVDPLTAPADAQFARTEETVRVRPNSGVLVDLKATRHARDAELLLIDAAGKPIEAGSTVSIDGGEASLVGYDGRVYVPDLAEHNHGVVEPGGCEFRFDYAPPPARDGLRPTIGPIACLALDALAPER